MNRHLRNIILIFLLTIATILGIMFYRMGFLKEVHFQTLNNQSFHLLYKKHKGAYHEIIKTLESVEDWAQLQNIPCDKTFGEYLDNPDQVDVDRLRSHAGCIISGPLVHPLPEGFFYKKTTSQNYLQALFEGSPAVGPMVVYPKAKEWLIKNGHTFNSPIIEVYEILNGGKAIRNYYYFPL